MDQKPRLLLTNDDGIQAPGLHQLWKSVSSFADTTIVAPKGEKSGAGLSITWIKPLHMHPAPWENETPAWSLNGTPADCVKMALATAVKEKPDMILSGINRGANSGKTVLYSGTVGGVIEGVLKGIPGIAFSFSDLILPPFELTEKYVAPIVQYFLKNPFPEGTLLNVNFPYNFQNNAKGIRVATQGKSYWTDAPEQRIHPEGNPYYWLGGVWGGKKEESHSDVFLLEQGYVTIVPIQVADLTCKTSFQKLKHLSEKDLFSDFSLSSEETNPV